MKKIHLLSLGGLFISSIVFAAPPLTLDDVNNQLDLVSDYSPPQSEREQRWKDFNAVPNTSGNIETVKVEGAEAVTHWAMSYAQCPSDYKLTGGGYLLTTFNGGHGYNAPNGSYADIPNNRWVVSRGGMGEHRGFKAYAVCMKK